MESISRERFDAALAAFSAIHDEDPQRPKAEIYHRTLARWVEDLPPEAGPLTDALRLAARCQHLRRWSIPRSDFPLDRAGYKQWRSQLTMLHVREASAVLQELGFPPPFIARVGDLISKKRFRSDAEAGRLEDAVCLTFLELEYAEFASQHPAEKLGRVVAKTWGKMSPAAHEVAAAFVLQWPDSPVRQQLLDLLPTGDSGA